MHRSDVRTGERRWETLIVFCDCVRGQDAQQLCAVDRIEGHGKPRPGVRIPLASEFENAMWSRSTTLAVYVRPKWWHRDGYADEPERTPEQQERWLAWSAMYVPPQREPLPQRHP